MAMSIESAHEAVKEVRRAANRIAVAHAGRAVATPLNEGVSAAIIALDDALDALILEVQSDVGCVNSDSSDWGICFDDIRRHDTKRWREEACVPCQARARLAAKEAK